ncbi:hypothetical protein L6164_005444 [Bauhinia variegata]|uniref:Uncharacterized protein n=1 Tax=Bauhinia variegata TaxID=167791 RepID=A0ACB9PQM5_BAUVA|nr:hypothetical protein L6164_005444 [Bauhinia variegata]
MSCLPSSGALAVCCPYDLLKGDRHQPRISHLANWEVIEKSPCFWEAIEKMTNENEDFGDEVVEVTGSKKDIWPPNVESYFIDLMEEEVRKGNRQTTTLTKAAWRHINIELKRKFGKEYTPVQFKNKFNQLRGIWREFDSLLKMESGLGYNSITGHIIATDNQWKKLYEKYKFAKKYKKKGCLHYDKLSAIFGDPNASSANQIPSIKSTSISNDDSEGENTFVQEEDDYQPKEKANVIKDIKKRKVAFANTLTAFEESSKKQLEILENMSTRHVTMSSGIAMGEVVGQSNVQDKESLMTCLRVLQGLEGIDGASFTRAVKLLKEDPLWRDVFLALTDKRKKDLVLNLV